MKILLLADPNSTHIIKWSKSLAEMDVELFIFGLSKYDGLIYENYKNIQVQAMGFDITFSERYLSKLIKYLKAIPALKKVIKRYRPDILHAHLASSYGLLGALSGFHPFILSIWGSEILFYPTKSLLYKALIKYNLKKADKVISTSHLMAITVQKYTNKDIEIIPFGIDLEYFKSQNIKSLFDDNDFVIGTIKMLEEVYGIEYLLKSFRLVKERNPKLPLKLLIVGGGAQESYLKNLANEFGIGKYIIFTGPVSYEEVPQYHNMLSIFVALSITESFGVAILEASACERPVVVSNVGGLPEVVENGVTGFIVQSKSPQKAAEAIEKLIYDKKLRKSMGEKGRAFVEENYNWGQCVIKMLNVYKGILDK